MDGGELDDIGIYGILGLGRLSGAVFIDCGCWDLGVVVGGGAAGGIGREGPDIYRPKNVYSVIRFFNKYAKHSKSLRSA